MEIDPFSLHTYAMKIIKANPEIIIFVSVSIHDEVLFFSSKSISTPYSLNYSYYNDYVKGFLHLFSTIQFTIHPLATY